MGTTVATLLRSRLSAAGVAVTTASALLFFALVALDLFGFLENPYTGILLFIIVPALFVIGLLLMPLGLWLERRRERAGTSSPWPSFDLANPDLRRAIVFVVTMTIVNLAIVSMASFGAVEYSESQAFCGQSCHPVMTPQFEAHRAGPHARLHCVTCHVGPGAGAFLSAKFNGSRQLWLVASGTHHRPVPAPIHNLPPVEVTCQQCHWPERYSGDVEKVFYEHADDQANTQSKTVVRLHVGGAVAGTGSGTGIHWHMNRANAVEFVAADDTREQIQYVRAAAPDGTVHEYFAEGVTADAVAGRPRRRMDCTDCHNRPAHTFGATPERAIDEALGNGLIDVKIPYVRREAVRALRGSYPSHDAAAQAIDRSMRGATNAALPHAFEERALRQAIEVTQAIYRRSVFPAMNITWGTYRNQAGHTTSNGCFRCHDDTHKTRDGRAIKQDCESCHSIE